MLITAYKTKKVIPGDNLFAILDTALPKLSEKSIVVISAKIVAICEDNVVKKDGSVEKEELVIKEAEKYIKDEAYYARTKTILTVKNHMFIPSSGIDLSNGNGCFVFWPKDPMLSAQKIWDYLRKKNATKDFGVILTDSCFMPLRRGAIGIGIAWCGFEPIANYIGSPDIFGEKLQYTTASHIDGLSAAAGVVMGEGNQQTPLAVITDVPFVNFVDRIPSEKEITEMKCSLENDYFAPLLTAAKWKRGGAE